MEPGYPLEDDLLLRPLAVVDGVQYFAIVNALSLQRVAGPFHAFGDAVIAARDLALQYDIGVWQERLDENGNAVGPPTCLFSARAARP